MCKTKQGNHWALQHAVSGVLRAAGEQHAAKQAACGGDGGGCRGCNKAAQAVVHQGASDAARARVGRIVRISAKEWGVRSEA